MNYKFLRYIAKDVNFKIKNKFSIIEWNFCIISLDLVNAKFGTLNFAPLLQFSFILKNQKYQKKIF